MTADAGLEGDLASTPTWRSPNAEADCGGWPDVEADLKGWPDVRLTWRADVEGDLEGWLDAVLPFRSCP